MLHTQKLPNIIFNFGINQIIIISYIFYHFLDTYTGLLF